MTEIETTGAGEANRREQAKQLIGQAGQTLKQEAQSFASAAQDRVRAEAQKGTRTATKTLGDFANAVRVAGDRLAETDQSPASRLVRQAADGLESLSRNLADKEPEDLLDAVRDFGRRNPVAFIGGAVLVGLALGRFLRASETGRGPRFSDDTFMLAEDDTFDGPAQSAPGQGGLERPLADDLGGLEPSTARTTTSPIGVDDGTSGIAGADTAATRRGGA
jgi:hypothetical protein